MRQYMSLQTDSEDDILAAATTSLKNSRQTEGRAKSPDAISRLEHDLHEKLLCSDVQQARPRKGCLARVTI